MRNHNLAKLSLPALEALAKSNPGALGWWLYNREQRDDLAERQIHFARIKHVPLYRETEPPPFEKVQITPSEVISRAKAEFIQAGGRHWKGLIRQPARDIAQQLDKHGRQRTAWMSDLLSQARQQGMQGNPPIEIKTTLMYHSNFIAEDGNGRRPALLMLKAAAKQAGKNRGFWLATATLTAEFNNIVDYAASEPEAAARANSWNGLVKASRKWHNAAALRKVKEELENALAQKGVSPNEQWEAPLAETELPDGFRAKLMQSPLELMQEALNMAHCAGLPDYIQRCRRGQARIFRLEQPETKRTKEATNVELAKAADGEWHIRQNQGYRNRQPTAAESLAAEELLAEWRKACRAQTSTCCPQQPNTDQRG